MRPYTERVIEVIRSIPEGYVMTYGQVARLAGGPRAHDKSSEYFTPSVTFTSRRGIGSSTQRRNRHQGR